MPSFTQLYDPDLPGEIAPGLALHLDPDRLLKDGATHTYTEQTRVQGQHFFLCVAASGGATKWVPLFTNGSAKRLALPAVARYGHPKWCQGVFHLYPDQIWTASPQAVANAAARAHDKSRKGSRNGINATLIPGGPW